MVLLVMCLPRLPGGNMASIILRIGSRPWVAFPPTTKRPSAVNSWDHCSNRPSSQRRLYSAMVRMIRSSSTPTFPPPRRSRPLSS